MKNVFVYNISKGDGTNEGVILKEVTGKYIKIKGIHCGIHKEKELEHWGDFDNYIVTDLETGYKIAQNLSYKAAIISATENIVNHKSDWGNILASIKERIKNANIELPVNKTINY